jgi:ketosteroid isomerase-like protein
MSEESTTPDLVELTRLSFEAGSRRDLDAALSFYGPDAVWDLAPMGLGTYDGRAAIRAFYEDWLRGYEEWEIVPEEIVDLGNGVTLTVLLQNGRRVGSTGRLQLRYASVSEWVEGLLARTTNYSDIDVARADAERLAGERG